MNKSTKNKFLLIAGMIVLSIIFMAFTQTGFFSNTRKAEKKVLNAFNRVFNKNVGTGMNLKA